MLSALNNDFAKGPRSLVDSGRAGFDVTGTAAADATLGAAVRAMYSAAMDAAHWPSALKRVRQCLGSSGLAVIIAPRGGGSPSCISDSISEEHLAELKTHLMRGDSSAFPGAGVSGTDRPRGREYWRPGDALEGLADAAPGGRQLVASLELQTGDAALSVLYRTLDETTFEADRIEAYAALVPHIGRAVDLSQHIADLDRRSRVLELAADTLPFGRFVIDQAGEVMLMNRAARAIIAKDDGLRVTGGRLCAARASDEFRLQSVIRESRIGPNAGRAASLTLPRPSGAHAYGIYATAVEIDGNPFPAAGLPAVEVTVIEPDRSTSLPIEFPRLIFALTETECMLARRLACGDSIEAAAAHLGITRHTAYLHLEHIYRKAGVHRHAELIRALLMPFVSAIPGQDKPT